MKKLLITAAATAASWHGGASALAGTIDPVLQDALGAT